MRDLPTLDYRENYLSMVHKVCQSIEYFLQDDMGLLGALSVTSAIDLVIDAVKNWPDDQLERQWLQSALVLVQRKGVRVLGYIV